MSANDRLMRSLPHLQNLIKRDPEAYREDVSELSEERSTHGWELFFQFKLQYLHFESQFLELTAKPDVWNKSLSENISFVSQVRCSRLFFWIGRRVRFRSLIVIARRRRIFVKCLLMFFDCTRRCWTPIFVWSSFERWFWWEIEDWLNVFRCANYSFFDFSNVKIDFFASPFRRTSSTISRNKTRNTRITNWTASVFDRIFRTDGRVVFLEFTELHVDDRQGKQCDCSENGVGALTKASSEDEWSSFFLL